MTKDVLVSVKGTQFLGEESDTVEIIAPGTYYLKNGKHYILYDETMEETEIVTHNTVKAAPGLVEVTKRGAVETRMVFEQGRKTMANYLTPIGLLVLGITTMDIGVKEGENEVLIDVNYALEMNGDPVSGCRLRIAAKDKREGALNLGEEGD